MRAARRPNFLILMVDEMRYPPPYELPALRAFRATYLRTQNMLRRHGVEFHRHYAASVACAPSRTSLYTGHYPSLHGVTETTGAAKAPADPDVFWLDPNGVPTMGHYSRAAGYLTFWKGKWHISDADLTVPGSHTALMSYDPETGAPDPGPRGPGTLKTDRLAEFGFSGWIGPEPHGQSPLNSGSSAQDAEGRDAKFARQTQRLIRELDASPDDTPWLIVSSLDEPARHRALRAARQSRRQFRFHRRGRRAARAVRPCAVPANTERRPLDQAELPGQLCPEWMQPIKNREHYSRLDDQLHKNVDERMMQVYEALMTSRFRDDTIVIFTSDHGDMLGAHGDMHQKWYTAYDEALRVPLIISSPALFPQARSVDALTSHVDILPTMLGLAGLDAEALRREIAPNYTAARRLVGRDLSRLALGALDPAGVTEPLYFMTDDDPSRGLNQTNWTGIAYNSVSQPNHIETVIARLDDGAIWKYSRYFDNPKFWTTPGRPGEGAQDVVSLEIGPPPSQPGTYTVPFQRIVKTTPAGEEREMYNLDADPMELQNLADQAADADRQAELARLLDEQARQKRLHPHEKEGVQAA